MPQCGGPGWARTARAGLRAAGAVAVVRAPPPRSAQCQAGGGSGWRLCRALRWGLRSGASGTSAPGELRARQGRLGASEAGGTICPLSMCGAPADRSWRGVGQGPVERTGLGGARGASLSGGPPWPVCKGQGSGAALGDLGSKRGGELRTEPLGLRRVNPGRLWGRGCSGETFRGPEPSWTGEEPRENGATPVIRNRLRRVGWGSWVGGAARGQGAEPGAPGPGAGLEPPWGMRRGGVPGSGLAWGLGELGSAWER